MNKTTATIPVFLPARNRMLWIDGVSRTITSAGAYVSRSGQSIAVILRGPIFDHPQLGRINVIKTHRVYLSLAECQHATEPRHLVNLASHKARRWVDNARAELWHCLTIDACRPMRAKCKPMLQAIAKWCFVNYGTQYWRKPKARAALRAELARMGIKCPPEGAALDFMCLGNRND